MSVQAHPSPARGGGEYSIRSARRDGSRDSIGFRDSFNDTEFISSSVIAHIFVGPGVRSGTGDSR